MRSFLTALTLLAGLLTVAPASAQLVSAPPRVAVLGNLATLQAGDLYDDFGGGAVSNVTGRAVSPFGGGKWTQTDAKTGGTNLTNPSVTSTGLLGLGTNSDVSTTLAWLSPTPTPSKWISWHTNPAIAPWGSAPQQVTTTTALQFVFDFSGTGSTNTEAMFKFTSASNAGNFVPNYGVAAAFPGATSFNATLANVAVWGGDVWSFVKRSSGASWFLDAYDNGWLVQTGSTDLSSPLGADNGTAGVVGNFGTLNPIDDVNICDPASQACLMAVMPQHTDQMKFWDGSNDTFIQVRCTYSQAAPPMVYAAIFNATTRAVIPGYSHVALNSYSAAGGKCSGNLTLPAASTPAGGIYERLERDDVAARPVYAFSAVQTAGNIWGIYSQSRGVYYGIKAIDTTTTNGKSVSFTVASPNNMWVAYGSSENVLEGTQADADRRNQSMSATGTLQPVTSTHYGTQLMAAWTGLTNWTFMQAGNGGTTLTQRDPSYAGPTVPGIFAALIKGLTLGGDIGYIALTDEVYDAENRTVDSLCPYPGVNGGTTCAPAFAYATGGGIYKQFIDNEIRAMEAAVGHPIRVLLVPMAGSADGEDQPFQDMVRLKWEIAQTNGTFGTSAFQRYYWAPAFMYDGQHLSAGTDGYHFVTNSAGNPLHVQRIASVLANLISPGSVIPLVGPTVDHIVRVDAQTMDVFYNKQGASALAMVLASTPDYRMGQTFSNNDSTFATANQVTPTGATITDIDATFAKVTYTFATNSFPTSACYRSLFGANPLTRAPTGTAYNDASIAPNVYVNASRLTGDYGDVYNPSVQPFINTAHASDNTHDFLCAA